MQRVAKFAKYARRKGTEPIVITTDFSGTLADPALLDDLPSDLEVHRVVESSLSSPSFFTRLRRRLGLLQFPDDHATYRRAAIHKARALARERHIDAVFISYGSPSTLIAGIRIAGWLGCPVVVDIRDFKRKNAFNAQRIRRSRPIWEFMIARIEAWAFANVDHFTVVSQSYKDILHTHYAISKDRTTVIYNGYDPEDFDCSSIDVSSQTEGPVLRYVGFVTHDPSLVALIAALSTVNESRSRKGDSPVRLEIVGGNSQQRLERMILQQGAHEWCSIRTYVPHDEAVALMRAADGLVLLQHAEHGCLTGKFFEYVGAARPILLLDNENHELRSLIEKNDLGVVAPHNNVERIVASIDEVLSKTTCRTGTDLDTFRRDIQADQFIEVIRKVTVKE